MNHLDIVDNRTLAQIREDGSERWPDGRPYIVRGLCCACGQPADEQHVCLIKLDKVQACGVHLQQTGEWTGPAYWVLNHTSACDACIQAMADMNSDNEEWLRPALDDIKARQQREHRRLFFSAMRRPEMRMLRAALMDLRWEHDIDWRNLTMMEIDIAPHLSDGEGTWMLTTDHHLIFCLWPVMKPLHFYVHRLHDADNPLCECGDCQESLICHVRLKDYYIAQHE